MKELPDDERADVVYLDPMFPHRTKSALIKKEMRLFQSLVGVDEDIDELLKAALTTARKRVVIKRPGKGAGIEGMKPHLLMSGKSTRYDIYFTHR
jgi:16S rRNA (guanine1516-N2)-methyltransferase